MRVTPISPIGSDVMPPYSSGTCIIGRASLSQNTLQTPEPYIKASLRIIDTLRPRFNFSWWKSKALVNFSAASYCPGSRGCALIFTMSSVSRGWTVSMVAKHTLITCDTLYFGRSLRHCCPL